MNTAVYVNFLRHLLFLLIILQLVGSVMLLQTNNDCLLQFKKYEILPWNVIGRSHSFFLACNFATMFVNMIEIGVILTNLFGFMGAVYLHTFPVVNFSAAINMMVFTACQFTSAVGMGFYTKSFATIIDHRLREVFLISNKQNPEKMQELNETRRDASFSYGLANEWSILADGSDENHTVIDYIQLKTKCCGLTGREFWRIRIPTSCCKEQYQGEDCILSRAYLTNCLYLYNNFKSCYSSVEFQSIIFGIMGVGSVIVALTLARYKNKYPDEEYDSESSSDSNDED